MFGIAVKILHGNPMQPSLKQCKSMQENTQDFVMKTAFSRDQGRKMKSFFRGYRWCVLRPFVVVILVNS